MKAYAAVPVKEPRLAKSRLAKVLDEEARAQLAMAMLRDVLSALTTSRELSSILVVSSSREVLKVAEEEGARPVEEGWPRGVNEALRLALELCLSEGVDALLIVPSDLPLLTSAVVSKLLSLLGPPPSMVISPAKGRAGTNALLLSPPNAVPFSFGPRSFDHHLSHALELGVDVVVYEAPELSLDVDGAEDLKTAMALNAGRWTASLLARLMAEERLPAYFLRRLAA